LPEPEILKIGYIHIIDFNLIPAGLQKLPNIFQKGTYNSLSALKLPKKGSTKVIYKGTFVSKQSLNVAFC
jgi:hypothetical protein